MIDILPCKCNAVATGQNPPVFITTRKSHGPGSLKYAIHCVKCGNIGPSDTIIDKAIENWNNKNKEESK